MEVEFQGVESGGCDDDFVLPVVELSVVVLHWNSDSPEERQIGHVQICGNHQFVQVDELDFGDFDGLTAFGEFEIDKEEAVSQFGDDQSVKRCLVGEEKLGVSDESGSTGPVDCVFEVISLDDFNKIKHFRIERVMVHGHDHDSTFSFHRLRIILNINQHQDILHNMKSRNVLGA